MVLKEAGRGAVWSRAARVQDGTGYMVCARIPRSMFSIM